MDPITIRHNFRPRVRSLRTCEVQDLFGLPDTEPPYTVADGVQLDPQPGEVVLFTGPSGGGKSSLLREAARQLGALDAQAFALPDVPLIDALAGPTPARLDLLSTCGLGEARLLLRTPSELSDGQRYRFRLAFALHQCPASGWVSADEFAAVLDRTLAKVVAFNLRKLCARMGVGVLLATTHDDLLDDLNPDLWVRCLGEGRVEVERRDVKKKVSASATSFGCRPAPSPTGRTSLGGITAAITSPS